MPVPELSIALLSVEYTQNHPRVLTPGIILQRTSVCLVRRYHKRLGVRVPHVYTWAELLEVLYARATIPRYSASFCKTFIPAPGTY